MGSANSNIVMLTLPNISALEDIRTGADFIAGISSAFIPPVNTAIEDMQSGADFLGGSFTPSDPNFADVGLLLNCDGTNGSTVFTDLSNNALAVTTHAPAAVSTTNPKFGSGAFDPGGSTGFLSIPTTPNGPIDLNGDFTFEFWLLFTTGVIGSALFSQKATSGGGGVKYFINIGSLGGGNFDVSMLFGTSAGQRSAGTPLFSPTLNTWYAIAFTMQSGILTAYLDGVPGPPQTVVGSPLVATGNLQIGATPFQLAGTTQMDEIRITNNIARYSGNYTPASAPFATA